jgi:hypothetical protein
MPEFPGFRAPGSAHPNHFRISAWRFRKSCSDDEEVEQTSNGVRAWFRWLADGGGMVPIPARIAPSARVHPETGARILEIADCRQEGCIQSPDQGESTHKESPE